MDLVSTTASQLNELERLVSNTERYTKRMRQYNELVRDEYFRAQRVLYLSRQMTAERKIENLGELNGAIRELKYSMSDLKGLMREYAIIKEKEEQIKKKSEIKGKLSESKEALAKKQVESSVNPGTQSRANQLTAQNTALLYESQLENNQSQREILEQTATTNRLLAEKLEDKRLKEMKKREFYGLEGQNE